ncbi:MAG: hypothetical protein IPJ34_22185 [Myxococcales bacterium]|nr:hypothetical protein [Myxococcales bacterium]
MTPCSVDVETYDLSVGRGIALVDVELRLSSAPCLLEVVPSLVAREEGRAAPEVALLVIDDGEKRLFSARLPPRFPVQRSKVRVSALLRGERFAAVPLALSHEARGTAVTIRTRSTWGARATAGDVKFVEHGLPALVTVDPLDDHAALSFSTSLAAGYTRTLVLDAGPRFGGPPERPTMTLRLASLAQGGAEAASVLATDLPLAVLGAETSDAAGLVVDEAARAAVSAMRSKDPLFAALGYQLAAGLARGFSGCGWPTDLVLPAPWTAPTTDLDTGCPHVSADEALPETLRARARTQLRNALDLPTIGPRGPQRTGLSAGPRRRSPVTLLLGVVLALGLAFAALAERRRSR